MATTHHMFVGVVCTWLFLVVPFAEPEYTSTLQATVHLAEDINRGAFTTVVKEVSKTLSPFLKVFSSVVKLIFGIGSASAQSSELEYLHRLSDSINLKFDQVNLQFSDVKKLIEWSAVQVSYTSLEANINAVSGHFRRIFEVPISAMDQQKQLFIMSYKNGYTDSGTKLYEGFMLDNGVISQGLLRPAMRYTENNRSQMRTFMLGILKLLVMAAKVELGYQAIKVYDGLIPFYSHLWQIRIEQVQTKMEAIDLELKNNYHSQSLKDIDKFSLNNLRLSNQNFSRNLYRELSQKYFWRDWLVVVSTHTEGSHDAHSRVCSSGVIKSTHRSKDLVIDSVEKDKPSFDINEVHKLCASLVGTCKNTATYIRCKCYHSYTLAGPCEYTEPCDFYRNTENADAIFNWFSNNIKNSCLNYSSIGIIATNKNPIYYAGLTEGYSSRLYIKDLGSCNYNAHFFG